MKIHYNLSESYFIKEFLFKDNPDGCIFVITDQWLKNIYIKDSSAKVKVTEGCAQILHFFHKNNSVEFSIKSATTEHSCDSFFVNVSLYLICTRLII